MRVRFGLRGCLVMLMVAAAIGMLLTACGADRPDPEISWAPDPVTHEGVRVLAEADADGFRLYTASGEKEFLPGINLGSTVPGHQPGEIDVLTATDYRRWFTDMGAMGIRVIRNYTLHPPAFYAELAAYNQAHQDAPLYLVQGVYLPNESYVEEGNTLYTAAVDDAFAQELQDVSAAVHGDLQRTASPGHASGTWDTDVSDWLVSWIIGVEWDPLAVARTDQVAADAAYAPGTYFSATAEASATERWLARHMDALAAAELQHGTSVPIAFANWPTTDPLVHPQEPLPQEDLAGVDANHVLPTDAWPGGTFASFHAYPYYPDFLFHEPELQQTTWRGETDPYAGYLLALKEHYAASMPVLITEVGVPASLGNAHRGPLGRDQGGHSEQTAMQINADLLHLIHEMGLSGGFIFSWTDEWFKRTWNTMESQDPARRQLWHDPLTNEQWFGIIATDSDRIPDAARELVVPAGPVEYLLADADASYVYLDVTARDAVPDDVELLVDTLPDGQPDYRVTIQAIADEVDGVGQAWVRAELDPLRLYTAEDIVLPEAGQPWHLFRQIVNRSLTVGGQPQAVQLEDVGALVRGSWDPQDADYDSRSTWHTVDRTIRLRIPWPMLGLAEPSSKLALGPGAPAELVPITQLQLTIVVDGQPVELAYDWPGWNSVSYAERKLAGISVLEQAFQDLG